MSTKPETDHGKKLKNKYFLNMIRISGPWSGSFKNPMVFFSNMTNHGH